MSRSSRHTRNAKEIIVHFVGTRDSRVLFSWSNFQCTLGPRVPTKDAKKQTLIYFAFRVCLLLEPSPVINRTPCERNSLLRYALRTIRFWMFPRTHRNEDGVLRLNCIECYCEDCCCQIQQTEKIIENLTRIRIGLSENMHYVCSNIIQG